MGDEFVLVPKSEVANLKAEINKLKSELDAKPKTPDVDIKSLIYEISTSIHKEAENERKIVLDNLNEIKELNKNTLDNLLTNTQALDNKFESLIDNFSSIVDNLSAIADKISDNSKNQDNKLLEEIKNSLVNKGSNDDIIKKLNEIEVFMHNLRVLLSYVKPNDLTMVKK